MPATRMRPSTQRERHDVRLLWGAGRAVRAWEVEKGLFPGLLL
jgi:hypothetical protein